MIWKRKISEIWNNCYLCPLIKIKKIMKNLVENLNRLFADFAKDAELNVNGNKAAGTRARKVSLEIEKALKNFRKESIAASK
jgi:predicted Holliday junction resolvase-like endonuclease